MVNIQPASLDRVFGALADPTRRAILERLARGDTTVTELASPFPSSLPAISKHLSVLEHAGLIVRSNDGRKRICKINPAAMRNAAKWIDHYRMFWTDQLDALDAYLSSTQEDSE
jgi:DNA-binding transcriptional ArsR family regulator